MAEVIRAPRAAADYIFHLDAAPPRRVFRRRLRLTGWLFHRTGEPIHGLRAKVAAPLRAPRFFVARRKRARPVIGAAYPELPEAAMSGFVLEIECLPFGPARLEIQVKDRAKNWQTIFTQPIHALPLDFLSRAGLSKVHQLFVRQLEAHYRTAAPHLKLTPAKTGEISTRLEAAERGLAPTWAPAAIRAVHLFVTSKSNLFIIEIAQLVCAGFREAGVTAELMVDQVPAEETPEDIIQIVVTPHEFYNLFLSLRLPLAQLRRLTQRLYLLSTEQPDSDWFQSNLVIAPYARAMLDISSLGVAAYRAHGLRCFHLPLGYHPMLERTSDPTPRERDFDIALLAARTDRREQFLAAHADFFSARNCHLRLVPIEFAKTEQTKSYLPAERRNALLQRSKILLNIHYSELRYFEWHRMLVALANGCCIITEPCEGFAPLVPGKHFMVAETERLIECCEHYLARPEEREAIARAGREFVQSQLTQAGHCRACLEQIKTGEPQSLGAEKFARGKTGGRPPASRTSELWRALRDDLGALFHPPERAPITCAPPLDDEEGVETIRERRRGYATRFARQEETRAAGGDAWQISDNEPFGASSGPAISVIVTLYNYARYIGPCLRSLERAKTGAIPGAIEIVIVDDASTDESLQNARAAQEQSARPVRLIAKKFNTGLADARNVGLRLARAPYAFILDADNLVFPQALAQLHAAIIAAGAAAAYSILCRFQSRPEYRSGLLSYYDWDPRMLVEHPYIDAMALFDREKLLSLGGYDNELFKIGWFGWEDYELWLRMAAAHLPVTFVPNIYGLYRHHEASMSNTTNRFELDLVRHLIGRYQSLIDEYQPKARVFGVEWARLQPNESTANPPVSETT